MNKEDDLEDIPELEEVETKNYSHNHQSQNDYTKTIDEINNYQSIQSDNLYKEIGKKINKSKSLYEKTDENKDIEKVTISNKETGIMKEIKEAVSSITPENNPEFIKKVYESEVLRNGVSNPRIMKIMNSFIKNPEKIKDHANDVELQKFLKEYLNIMQKEVLKNNESKIKDSKNEFLIKDRKVSEIEQICQDKEIQLLLELLKLKGRLDIQEIAYTHSHLVPKVKRLIELGFFQLNR